MFGGAVWAAQWTNNSNEPKMKFLNNIIAPVFIPMRQPIQGSFKPQLQLS